MAVIMAVASFKGGSGKSSTALNTGIGLAERGYKVLLVDLDPQACLTDSLHAPARHPGAYEVLKGSSALQDARTHYKGFDLLQGSQKLLQLSAVKTCTEALRDGLEAVKEEYDFILVDSSPAMSELTQAALAVADWTIVPCEADRYNAASLKQVLTLVPGGKVLGVLISRYERTSMGSQYRKALQDIAENAGTSTFRTVIRKCNKVREAQALQQNLFRLAPRSNAVTDYNAFLDEILERLKGASGNG